MGLPEQAARRLELIRNIRGWSLDQASAAIGLPASTIRSYEKYRRLGRENGGRMVSLGQLEHLSQLYGVGVMFFLEPDDTMAMIYLQPLVLTKLPNDRLHHFLSLLRLIEQATATLFAEIRAEQEVSSPTSSTQ